MLRRSLFAFLGIGSLCYGAYCGQFGQDQFVNETFFKNKQQGVFVDIGAFDGTTISNTFFFEKELNWTGICIEPHPDSFKELVKARRCICINGCIAPQSGTEQFLYISAPAVLSGLFNTYDPRHVARIYQEVQACNGKAKLIQMPCYTFNEVLQTHGIKHVDFLSLDTEGGEYDILESIDFSLCPIDVITVEDNYDDPRFAQLLEGKGYRLASKKSCDLIFVRKDVFPS
jgi:FkbM family methyltransferase